MKAIEKITDKIVSKRHKLIVDESNVLEVLSVIDRYKDWYINTKLSVKPGSYDNSNVWFVRFNASDVQWKAFIGDLDGRDLKLVIKYPETIRVIKEVSA